MGARARLRQDDTHPTRPGRHRSVSDADVHLLHRTRHVFRRLERAAVGLSNPKTRRPRWLGNGRRLPGHDRQLRRRPLRVLVHGGARRHLGRRSSHARAPLQQQLGWPLARRNQRVRERLDRGDVPALVDDRHARIGRAAADGALDHPRPRRNQRAVGMARPVVDSAEVHLGVPADDVRRGCTAPADQRVPLCHAPRGHRPRPPGTKGRCRCVLAALHGIPSQRGGESRLRPGRGRRHHRQPLRLRDLLRGETAVLHRKPGGLPQRHIRAGSASHPAHRFVGRFPTRWPRLRTRRGFRPVRYRQARGPPFRRQGNRPTRQLAMGRARRYRGRYPAGATQWRRQHRCRGSQVRRHAMAA